MAVSMDPTAISERLNEALAALLSPRVLEAPARIIDPARNRQP
jgi:hypothetical protein